MNQSTDINTNSLLQLRFHEWLTVCVVVTRVHVAELFEALDCVAACADEWGHGALQRGANTANKLLCIRRRCVKFRFSW